MENLKNKGIYCPWRIRMPLRIHYLGGESCPWELWLRTVFKVSYDATAADTNALSPPSPLIRRF